MIESNRTKVGKRRKHAEPRDWIKRYLEMMIEIEPDQLLGEEHSCVALTLGAMANLLALQRSQALDRKVHPLDAVAQEDALILAEIVSHEVWGLCTSLLQGLFDVKDANCSLRRRAATDPFDRMGNALDCARPTLARLDALNHKLRTLEIERQKNARHEGALDRPTAASPGCAEPSRGLLDNRLIKGFRSREQGKMTET